MRKIIVNVSLLALFVLALSACKGDKKTDTKAEEPVKTEQKTEQTNQQNQMETTTSEHDATANLSEQAKKGFEIMESFQAEKCSICHEPDKKKIGPAWKDVAKGYKEKKGNIVQFLKGNAKSIIDPAQFNVMKPNIEATKKLSGDQLAAIAAYIRSFE